MTQEQSQELRHLIVKAHYEAAINNQGNISVVASLAAYQGSGNPYQAIAAGILSMGGMHAPIDAARSLVKRYNEDRGKFREMIAYLLKAKIRIPGFGNSFYKDQIDPSFQPAYNKYLEITGLYNPVEIISEMVNRDCKERGKPFLHPNAAIITAAIAELLELPPGQEISLALQGRITAWVNLFGSIEIKK